MRLSAFAVIVAALAGSVSCAPGAPRAAPAVTPDGARPAGGVVLDGRFDDWRAVPEWTRSRDPGESSSPVALRRAWATDDASWWYLSIEISDTLNVLAMPGTLHLLVDADADPATGATAFDMTGVDFSVDLSRTDKTQGDGHGTGAALRTVDTDGLAEFRSPYDNGMVALPSWSSTRFELRIARAGSADGFARLAQRVRAQFLFEAASGARAALPVTAYQFTTSASPVPSPNVSTIPRPAGGATRVAHWNVSEGSFRDPARHAKLLAAVAPHIVMLDEAHSTISDSSLTDFFARPELAALGRWTFHYSLTGGRQKTVVATRVGSLRPANTMRRVEYSAGALDSLRTLVPDAFKHAMDTEAAAQLSSTGAWIMVDGVETLFVPVDLQSGGFHNSGQDMLRMLQARTLRERIDRELATRNPRAPVVIGGDFNTVGSFAPLRELARSLDADGSALAIAEPLRLGDNSTVTWASAVGAQFSPGQLDFTLFSDAVFERTGGFVFSSSDLAPALSAALGLTPDMSARTSDHMIVVTDLRRRR